MEFSLRLKEIARAVGAEADADFPVSGLASDSREVKPGFVFFAIEGVKVNGGKYIADAIARGAAAIVEAKGRRQQAAIPVIGVENPRLALAKAAAAFYSRQPEYLVAVTGTDGKTSTAEFYRQLAEMRGHKAAALGTLGIRGQGGEMLADATHTTPDAIHLHQALERLHDDGYTHAALEASSHGLHQHRLDGVRISRAAFTNLTRDHLDYHGDQASYFAAKARLFSEVLPEEGVAVLNADDARYASLRAVCESRRIRVVSYGRAGEDLRIESITPKPGGQEVRLMIHGRAHAFHTGLVGAFQVHNMLAALGLLGEDAGVLLPKLKPVPGRMERVASARGAEIYIDYAHTPAALSTALATLRPHTAGKLVVVFGCGGDRDKGKRPEMGKAAAKLADAVIVTDDNPRTEDAATIRAEVLAGAPDAKSVSPREEAIRAAIAALSAGDVLLVAGKGHEKTQVIGNVSHAFDDAEVIRRETS